MENRTGRILFTVIFLVSGSNHFSPVTIAYAPSQGVPVAAITVPLFGVIAIGGKWKPVIFNLIVHDVNRFGEMLRVVEGLSKKVLTT